MTTPTILLTGATGYIGSHTWLALEAAGMRVVGLDNFANSSPRVLERLQALGAHVDEFVEGDVSDASTLDHVFGTQAVDAVVHFAAFKAVGESTREPLAYYANNIGGLMSLLAAMKRHASNRLVFSSSATVYGNPATLPIREDAALSATNPYGATKLMSETIVRDVAAADPSFSAALLRYFNPVGAHESGTIGEDPRGTPNNLMPYIAQVAVGKRASLSVFGSDYATPDGTGVRDYLHVLDLAEGHVAALRHLLADKGTVTVNLGTGNGFSVLELVRAFEVASGRAVPYELVARRPGDIDSCFADASLARELLGWQSTRGLDAMCRDSWRWQSQNPDGFGG